MALRRLIDSERESEGASIVESTALRDMVTGRKPKKRSSAYNRRYKAAFKKISSRHKLKSGKWKKGGFKAAVKAAHKEAKK